MDADETENADEIKFLRPGELYQAGAWAPLWFHPDNWRFGGQQDINGVTDDYYLVLYGELSRMCVTYYKVWNFRLCRVLWINELHTASFTKIG